MDEGFVKFIGWLFGFFAILYLVMLIVAVAVVVASLCVGLVAFLATKSTKALVTDDKPADAFMMAIEWSSVLTVGCIVGSFGLLVSLSALLGADFSNRIANLDSRIANAHRVGDLGGIWTFWIFLEAWIMPGAYRFWLKTAAVLYIANRVYVARKVNSGSNVWLQILPPLFALAIFAMEDHWDLFLRVLVDPTSDHMMVAATHFWNSVFIEPIDLLGRAVSAPDSVFVWLGQRVISSDGSLFKLKLLPLIFWILTVAFASKAVWGTLTAQDVSS